MKSTDSGESEREKSSWRLSPVGEISIEQSDTNDADDHSQIDGSEHQVESRRDLQHITRSALTIIVLLTRLCQVTHVQ